MPRCGSPMKLGIQVEGKTDVGRVRTNNEDNFGFDIREGIFVVCDGMGGRAAGERASQIAVETVLGYFQHDLHGADTQILGKTFESVSQRANALNRAIQLANQAIHEEAARNPIYSGMGSTIVAVLVDGNLFSLANVGDSRVYVIRGEAIQQLTNDHSLVMEQVRRGLITLEEAENSAIQNVIVRALGSEESVEPDLENHEFTPGDILLLCSDGLSRYVKESTVMEVTRYGRFGAGVREVDRRSQKRWQRRQHYLSTAAGCGTAVNGLRCNHCGVGAVGWSKARAFRF